MLETPEIRLKRLKMRSWRRGTKEMDLILGPFSDESLLALTPALLDDYEALLEENDQDLYQWFSGQLPAPEKYQKVIHAVRPPVLNVQ